VVVAQGEVWWADLGVPIGSAPGYRRPVVIVQCDAFNRSKIATVVCVPLTTNTKWADVPGNVLLSPQSTSLSKDSVANASQILSVDKDLLTDLVGQLPRESLDLVLAAIDAVLGR
jgi:mRNA interferase MazF